MTSSNRRLASTPSRRRKNVSGVAELVAAFIAHQRAMGRSEATVRHYEDSLRLFARCLAENGIEAVAEHLTAHTMNLFAGWLRSTPTRPWRGKTERSIHGVHGALKDVKIWVRWLASEELIERAPKVPVPKLPTKLFPVLTDTELERVFACSHLSAQTEIAARNRALVAFMLDTGVRLSEAAGVRLSHISLKDGSAKIRGKGSKERLVYFSDGVAEAIRRWLTIRGDDEEQPLFWLKPAGIRMLFKRIKEETGLDLFTPHQVRHTALTMLVRDGVDLHTIKRLAGHASVTTIDLSAWPWPGRTCGRSTVSPRPLIGSTGTCNRPTWAGGD